ncbi:hypothetical protein VaNZ11_013700 [Volvox africanus]|uniref:Uncharacterized protein n=1 Tax=Volvox africanus TaxID=51714 RepID=A0ABQ5SI47_9CHLO|nr:hypothetical protein VaNZ11_013700 [Volvox africanus]
MEVFEEVADTFSDCECPDFFSSRMGSLSLSLTSNSFDPAFTFDTSSRSSSLRHCGSSSRSPTPDVLPPAPPLLAVVSTSPCASTRRAVSVIRRTSLSNAPATDASARTCRPAWLPDCSNGGGGTSRNAAAIGTPEAPSFVESSRGSLKRRSCSEADPVDSQASEPPLLFTVAEGAGGNGAGGPASSSEVLPPSSPSSPASSFASFAAALAAHYYADFGSVPDVPEHLEQVRQRTNKRQRMGPIEQLTDT